VWGLRPTPAPKNEVQQQVRRTSLKKRKRKGKRHCLFSFLPSREEEKKEKGGGFLLKNRDLRRSKGPISNLISGTQSTRVDLHCD
jgi:hypothetical protein